ncbi:MAG: hypothetical protein WED87_06520 [Dehalococcoidia bacterium]
MRKTSVYLEERQIDKLRRLSRCTDKAPAEIIRDAIDALPDPDSRFAIFDSHDGDGRSVEDIPRRERLQGFGDR